MADWNSVEEDFGIVNVDYANLSKDTLLDIADLTDENKDELSELGGKLGVSIDTSQELSTIVEQLNEEIKLIEPVVEVVEEDIQNVEE